MEPVDPMEPVAQLEPNFDKIVIGWSSSKIVSGGPRPLTKMAAQLYLV
jgi:hypothetical protein